MKLKRLLIKNVIKFNRCRWKAGSTKRVLISLSDYFTEKKWKEKMISEPFILQTQDWDVVYSRSRFDFYRHYDASDACFLYGLSSYCESLSKKLLYFPMQGLDGIYSTRLDGHTVVVPPAYSSLAIAEYCLAMSINSTRGFPHAFMSNLRREWKQKPILLTGFRPLSDHTIGILGVGKIGGRICKTFRDYGCQVVGCDIKINTEVYSVSKCYSVAELDIFLQSIDILIISLPLTDQTKGMLTADKLEFLQGKTLINVSRGEIIDEKALITALKRKKIRAAVLDVFQREPLPQSSALFDLPNAIITPHIAGNINLFADEIQEDFLSKTIEYFKHV